MRFMRSNQYKYHQNSGQGGAIFSLVTRISTADRGIACRQPAEYRIQMMRQQTKTIASGFRAQLPLPVKHRHGFHTVKSQGGSLAKINKTRR